jgi:ArsR family transcriptional regulator
MALGVCTAATVMNRASVRAMPIRVLTVAVESEKLSAPSRYGRIRVRAPLDGLDNGECQAYQLRNCLSLEVRNSRRTEWVDDKQADFELYRMQAEIAKVLGSPVRLRILNLIGDGEVANGTLLDDLGISRANLSQHLAVLRRAGVVSVRRDGPHVYYRLTFPEIKDLCSTMREILAKHLTESGRQGKRLMRRAR